MKKWLLATLLVFSFVFSEMVNEVHADKVELNLQKEEVAYTFFDLSYGESTLIQGSSNQAILINTGHQNSRDELRERLEMYNVQKINTLILTSRQEEYAGNLSWLLENWDVEKVIVPEVLTAKFSAVLKNTATDRISTYKKGDHFALPDGVEVDVLYVENRQGRKKGGSAFFIEHLDQKLLYLAIADVKVEEKLVSEYDLKATVIKVPDFGSDRGTSEGLLTEADPQIAVIFQRGEDPPSNFVLERLEETWIDIYQTSRIGTVTIKCMDHDYEIITVRPSEHLEFPKNWRILTDANETVNHFDHP
ncbi:Metal-dependent hydrolase, beta-lactamase superfamily II [Evansella caseinilytica]|uniref:Metal-dependent hydrolase, beta-lactamase superfamily II n=1 Tax=Evansella caseinilytica TaxID=1503961 RepID=A0A1H3NIT1_9BACI|nr:hypothetical protein [Evansella caseinilytica]SDY88345.1 Metal-dependent hydrolase, beta-lactamase superfamily II [Evansella caseinilytica]